MIRISKVSVSLGVAAGAAALLAAASALGGGAAGAGPSAAHGQLTQSSQLSGRQGNAFMPSPPEATSGNREIPPVAIEWSTDGTSEPMVMYDDSISQLPVVAGRDGLPSMLFQPSIMPDVVTVWVYPESMNLKDPVPLTEVVCGGTPNTGDISGDGPGASSCTVSEDSDRSTIEVAFDRLSVRAGQIVVLQGEWPAPEDGSLPVSRASWALRVT